MMKMRGKGGFLDFSMDRLTERNKENSFLDVDWVIEELLAYGHEKAIAASGGTSLQTSPSAARTSPAPTTSSSSPQQPTTKAALASTTVVGTGKSKMRGAPLPENQIRQLCMVVREVFLQQPMLLELEAPVHIAGDIHGQFQDLLRHFDKSGYPPDANYLFLGDYVDRGKESIETMCLLFAYKIKYPENFFLLRGNHECAGLNRIYGFYDECKRKYSVKLWKSFVDVFNCLPVAAVVEGTIFCAHAGLSPQLYDLDLIIDIQRPIEVPQQGLLCDILWSDPDRDTTGWEPSDRGVSYRFGTDVVDAFLTKNNLSLIVRAHQVVEDGYEFFHERSLVTIFSAPNYCGQFDNAGALMLVKEDLTCSFSILPPQKKQKIVAKGPT